MGSATPARGAAEAVLGIAIGVSVAIDGNRPDETLLAQVSKVASAWVERTTIVVSQVAGRHHPKAADDT